MKQKTEKGVTNENVDSQEKEEIMVEEKEEKKPFNPLSKGRYIVRFYAKKRGIAEKDNPYYGNYAPSAHSTFVVPQTSNGTFVKVLSREEEEFYEDALGLEKGALNINKKEDNFWSSNAKNGISRVTLSKDDTFFDKSDPADMLRMAVLRANSDVICPSLKELEERQLPTYKWYIIDESAKHFDDENVATQLMECTKIMNKYFTDKWVLKYIIEKTKNVQLSPRTTLNQLQGEIAMLITDNVKKAYAVMTDTQLLVKSNMAKARAYSIINLRNGLMFYDNRPLAAPGFEANERNSANFLSDAKNQELYLEILSKIPEE
jgi:hypothetical protein